MRTFLSRQSISVFKEENGTSGTEVGKEFLPQKRLAERGSTGRDQSPADLAILHGDLLGSTPLLRRRGGQNSEASSQRKMLPACECPVPGDCAGGGGGGEQGEPEDK